MRLSVPENYYNLTGKVFRYTVLSFFVSSIITVMGTMMDSFTASKAMDEATAAAVGFVSPAVILFSLIGTTTAVGFQITCIRSLSVTYEFITTAVCSILLWLLSDIIARLYLGNVSEAVME